MAWPFAGVGVGRVLGPRGRGPDLAQTLPAPHAAGWWVWSAEAAALCCSAWEQHGRCGAWSPGGDGATAVGRQRTPPPGSTDPHPGVLSLLLLYT